MEKNINIFDYLHNHLIIADYAELMEKWEVHRGAEGVEDVFDLLNYRDFYLFATLYGIEQAVICQKKNRFWFGGTNYLEDSIGTMHKTAIEFPTDIVDARKLVINSIDDEYILERRDIYERYFDFDKFDFDYNTYLRNDMYYAPNQYAKKELEYPIVLQWFTAILYPIVSNYSINCNYYSNDVMDAIANMAYDFRNEYKNTIWKTTFNDYLLHYAYNNAEKYFNDIFFNSDIVKIKEDIKSDDFWYE